MASLSYVASRARWRVRYRATHRRTHTVFAGSQCFVQKPEAVKFWADIEQQERDWRAGHVHIAASIRTMAAEFERYCTRHTPRTQDLYRRVISKLLDSLPPSVRRAHQFDTRAIDAYLDGLRQHGGCNRTLNAHLTAIKAFCHFFADRLDIANPARKISMLTEDPPRSRFLTPSEYDVMIARANPLNRDRLIFFANTGLRASEFCQLPLSGQLTPDARSVTVIGKGRRPRTVPLNAACRDCLTRDHIDRPLGRNALFQAFSKIARRAGIPSLGPHSLRHYFATQMLLRGVPIAIVAKLLGHSVRVCETTYAHILPPDLQAVTAILDAPTARTEIPTDCP